MTLTLSAILTAPSIYLHIEGDTKRRVFDSALHDARSRLPIRALLAHAPRPPRLFWCPDTPKPRVDLDEDAGRSPQRMTVHS